MNANNPFNLIAGVNFTRQQVADACRQWGPAVRAGSLGIDGVRLLWALSGNESSYGLNCGPRHEPVYCTGRYSAAPQIVALTAKYAHNAHCSFGPWQMMLANFTGLYSLSDFGRVGFCAMQAASFINTRILMHGKATTIEQIADAYNTGDWRDSNVPEKYIADCVRNYNEVPLPAASVAQAAAQ